jgi:hypothetical protein
LLPEGGIVGLQELTRGKQSPGSFCKRRAFHKAIPPLTLSRHRRA